MRPQESPEEIKTAKAIKEEIAKTVQNTKETLKQLDTAATNHVIGGNNVAPVINIPDRVFERGGNLAEEMFKHMDSLDKVLTASLKKAKRDTVDELKRYRLEQIDRNKDIFRRAYAMTKYYVINGGEWEKGCLISAVPDGWDGKPTKCDDVTLNWKQIKHFDIYPPRPLD